MGIPTLIKTLTASGSATLSFVDGASDVTLDSTYDEYMFVFTDIGPATNDVHFQFQVNATDDAGGGYDTSLITSTSFYVDHSEADANNGPTYATGSDLAQSSNFQILASSLGNGSDESAAGILHLFSPASTTYVKHFYCTVNLYRADDYTQQEFVAGYINDTTAIDEIRFKMSSGNFDGVIQLFGIA
jgi:hypothetical protein